MMCKHFAKIKIYRFTIYVLFGNNKEPIAGNGYLELTKVPDYNKNYIWAMLNFSKKIKKSNKNTYLINQDLEDMQALTRFIKDTPNLKNRLGFPCETCKEDVFLYSEIKELLNYWKLGGVEGIKIYLESKNIEVLLQEYL